MGAISKKKVGDPAKKASSTKPAAPVAKAAKESAKEADKGLWKDISPVFFSTVKEVVKREEALGFAYIRSYPDDDVIGDDEDEEGEENNNLYTLEGFKKMRFIIVTQARNDAIQAGHNFVSGGQDGGVMMFNTSSGNDTIYEMPDEIKKAMKGADKKKHLDRLLGLTSALKDMDMWLHDNECWGDGNELDEALKLLGQTWKKLLKSSDAVLGIDKEFTRPGIDALLEDLEEMVSECSSGDYTLPWK